jgi:hypothetical protein
MPGCKAVRLLTQDGALIGLLLKSQVRTQIILRPIDLLLRVAESHKALELTVNPEALHEPAAAPPDEQPVVEEVGTALSASAVPRVLIRGLSKAFPSVDGPRLVVNDFTLSLFEGQVLCLLGHNGEQLSVLLICIVSTDLPC